MRKWMCFQDSPQPLSCLWTGRVITHRILPVVACPASPQMQGSIAIYITTVRIIKRPRVTSMQSTLQTPRDYSGVHSVHRWLYKRGENK